MQLLLWCSLLQSISLGAPDLCYLLQLLNYHLLPVLLSMCSCCFSAASALSEMENSPLAQFPLQSRYLCFLKQLQAVSFAGLLFRGLTEGMS